MKLRKVLSLVIPISCLASCQYSNDRKVYLYYGENILRTEIVKLGQEYAPPSNIDTQGYKFIGWYLNPAFTDTMRITSPITVVDDIHLYAKYDVKHFIVTYECYGSERYQDKYFFPVDYGHRAVNIDGSYFGDEFKGWFQDKDFKVKYDFIQNKITCDTTIYGLFGKLEP